MNSVSYTFRTTKWDAASCGTWTPKPRNRMSLGMELQREDEVPSLYFKTPLLVDRRVALKKHVCFKVETRKHTQTKYCGNTAQPKIRPRPAENNEDTMAQVASATTRQSVPNSTQSSRCDRRVLQLRRPDINTMISYSANGPGSIPPDR